MTAYRKLFLSLKQHWARFAERVGEFVVKPQGKPTLANEQDSRKEYSSAAADFSAVVDKK